MKSLKVKRLHPDAVMPRYATDGSAGMDLTAINLTFEANPGAEEDKYIYSTGLSLEIPEGFVGLLFPRSSIHKTGMQLTNSVGVIDQDYRGELKFIFGCSPGASAYAIGDRVGQLVILEIPKIEIEEVIELTSTQRGTGGFGSTGR